MTDKRPKIAVFRCGFVYSGGGERIVLEEVMGLRGRGYEVDCFALTLDKQVAYPDFIEGAGVETFPPQLLGGMRRRRWHRH